MKVMARVGNETVCVQIVRREKPREMIYVRRCAYTMDNPTPEQLRVRATLARGAMSAYRYKDKSREDVLKAVERAFSGWRENRKPTLNDVEQVLYKCYPEQLISIKEVE